MVQELNQECPLCNTMATYAAFNFDRRKRFRCDNCGSFVITVGAENRLANSPKSWREALKIAAGKAPTNTVLEIRLSPVEQRTPGVASPTLDTEYIPR